MHCPSLNLFGTFFPSWMLCGLVGVGGAIVAYLIAGLVKIRAHLEPPLLVYPAFALTLTFLLWLTRYGARMSPEPSRATRSRLPPLTAHTVGRAIALAVIAAAVILAVVVIRRLDALPRTDDAIITANTIRVAPEIAGRIATLNVKDDETVKQGDILFTIERERYDLHLAQARAHVQALEAQIGLTDREVAAQLTGVSVAKAHAEAARARLQEATDTLGRLEPLLPDRYVTPQQVDLARTAKATAQSQLVGALSATEQSRQAVGDSRALAAQLLAARAQVALAERDVRNTEVRAPFAGRIVGVTTSVGQLVDPLRSLFTLIDTSRWYVVADFRETELPNIRPGDPVAAYVMSDPDVRLKGSVESIGSAVAELDLFAIAGVPPVKRDLNWIRIAQRFPVRILLQDPPEELMRIGASAVVVIRHGRR